jgi:hypothetical protein
MLPTDITFSFEEVLLRCSRVIYAVELKTEVFSMTPGVWYPYEVRAVGGAVLVCCGSLDNDILLNLGLEQRPDPSNNTYAHLGGRVVRCRSGGDSIALTVL